MDLQQVEAFLVVGEELHFGRSAGRLHLSQSRVSRLVASLEQEIGAPLFERTSRRVRLTPLGVAFREEVGPAYRQLVAAGNDARRRAREVSGDIHIGCTPTTAVPALTGLVAAAEAQLPGCAVVLDEVEFGRPFDALRAGDVDLVVNWLVFEAPDLVAGPVLGTYPRAVAMSSAHPLAGRRSITLDDVADEGVAHYEGMPDAISLAMVPERTPTGRPIRRTHEVHSAGHLVALIASGRIVHPTVAGVPLFQREGVVLVPLDRMAPIDLGLIWCRAHEDARVRAVADVARSLGAPPRSVRAAAPAAQRRRSVSGSALPAK